jgi:hypothetical protein
MSFEVVKQLFGATRYLRVRAVFADAHGREKNHKAFVDWWLPLMLSGTAVLCTILLPSALPIAGDKGLVESVGGLLEALTGFYVASLAAVATFPNSQLSANAVGYSIGGNPILRRNFICLLFGYLATLSITIYVAGLASSIPLASVALIESEVVRIVAAKSMVFVYLFACCQLLTVTLLGLYYLAVRIHQSEPVAPPIYAVPTPDKTGTGSGKAA